MFLEMYCPWVLFVLSYSLSGMDASAQTSSHEMTIPNDVRALDE